MVVLFFVFLKRAQAKEKSGAVGVGAGGRARAGTLYVLPGVPLLPNFGRLYFVRRRVGVADGCSLTVL